MADNNCPKNLVSIEASAFYNCVNLSEVTIPDSVTDIGQNAFDETNIVNSQNSAIKYVGKWVVNFTDKTAEDVTIKDGTVGIAQCAFVGGVALKSVRLPDSLLYINDNAFSYCKNLSNVTIGDKVKYIGRYAFNETQILKNQDTAVKYIGNWLVDCDKDVTDVIVKDGTYGISSSAFSYAKLQTITIPESVKVILREAFSGTPLIDNQSGDVKYADNWIIDCNEKATKVQIKEETVGIADSAFSFCNNITEIVLPDSLETINDNAFFNCTGLSSMVIPTTVKNISLNAIGYISPAYAQGYNHQQTEGFVLNVYSNTAGENYAKINRFNYTVLDDINKLTGVKVKTQGSTSLTLAWDKNASASGYVVEQYKGGKWTQIAKTSSNATVTYTVNGLKADTTYTFRIKGYVVSGTTEYSGEYTRLAAKTRIPNVASFKGRAVSASAVKLDWSKNDKATGYVIEQYKGGKWTQIAKTSSNTAVTYTVNGLAADTTYTFRIKAYAISGESEIYSDYVRIAGKTRIPNVAKFTGSAVSASAVKLDWSKNDKATGYVIEQYKGGKWTVLATTKNNTTLTFTVKGLADDTAYSFRIKSYRTANGVTDFSEYTSVKAKTLLGNVKTFTATATGTTAIKLDWSKNDKATGYVIEQYRGGKWTTIATTKNNTTLTFTVKGLAEGTTYSFRIKSFRKTGSTTDFSEYTAIKAATLLDGVSDLKATSVTGSWITLEWAKNDKATGYSIEQYKGGKWTVIATTKNNATLKFTVKGLKNDTTYSFRIRAYKTSGGVTAYSDYVRIVGKTRIPNVAKFTGSAVSASAVKLDWSKNDKATGYVIEQYKGGKWTAIATTKNNTTLTFTVKGLAKGTTYSFRIKSFRKTGSTTEFSEYTAIKAGTDK